MAHQWEVRTHAGSNSPLKARASIQCGSIVCVEGGAIVNPQSTLAALFDAPVNPGRVVWIGIRPARREPLRAVESVVAQAGQGLVGDHYKTKANGPRQLTLIQAEHLPAIAGYLHRDAVTPEMLRRNIVVKGINLLGLKGRQFLVGSTLCEYTGECHPCSRMEEILGVGGYNAVRGHGGITARVLATGSISVGDSVRPDAGLPSFDR